MERAGPFGDLSGTMMRLQITGSASQTATKSASRNPDECGSEWFEDWRSRWEGVHRALMSESSHAAGPEISVGLRPSWRLGMKTFS